MTDKKQKELVLKLFGPDQANEIVSEIDRFEILFRDVSELAPDKSTTDNIKWQIRQELAKVRSTTKRRILRPVAAIAAAIAIVLTSVSIFHNTSAIRSDDLALASISWDNSDIETLLEYELETLESEIKGQLSFYGYERLEEEFLEIEEDFGVNDIEFWEG